MGNAGQPTYFMQETDHVIAAIYTGPFYQDKGARAVHNSASSARIIWRPTTLVSPGVLEEHAEDLGVLEQEAKRRVPVLMWRLVFSFVVGESRPLTGFRRGDRPITDEPISPSGFYHRSTPALTEYFSDSVEHVEAAYRERVARFPEFGAIPETTVENGLSIGFVPLPY